MQVYKAACRSKSMEISSLAKSDQGLPGQGGVKAEGNGAGSTRSAAAAAAEKTSLESDVFSVC